MARHRARHWQAGLRRPLADVSNLVYPDSAFFPIALEPAPDGLQSERISALAEQTHVLAVPIGQRRPLGIEVTVPLGRGARLFIYSSSLINETQT